MKALSKMSEKKAIIRALLFSLLICGMMVLGFKTPVCAATTYTSGDWEYTVSEGEATLTAYNGSSKTITIPSKIGGYTVTGIGKELFYESDITSLSIPSSIEDIDDRAFANCRYLKSIYFDAKNCHVTDTWQVKSLYVFLNAGEYSDSLTVTFGPDVKTIPGHMFDATEDNYAHVTKVVIPENVEVIGTFAFYNCYDLSSLTLSEGLVTIEDDAFVNCLGLTSLTIPSTVEYIGMDAFTNLKNLKKLYFNAVDCDVYSNAPGKQYAFDNMGKLSSSLSVVFGSGVTKIPDGIFRGTDDEYPHITSVTIPSTVTEIGYWAFYNCKDLKTVTIKTKTATITDGYYDSFGNCPSTMTFKCYRSSTAKTYASEQGYNISYLDPKAPTISSISNTTSGVKIKWGKISNADGYIIYRKVSGGSYSKLKTIKSGSTVSYTDETAAAGKTYYYKVLAYRTSGSSTYKGSFSSAKSIKYLTAGKITGLSNTSSGIKIKWSKVTGASGYYIYRKTSSGSFKKIKTITSGSTLTYTDTAVKSKNGTTYTYCVKAYSGSSKSSYVSKTTVRLTGVSISSVSNSSSKKIKVKWAKNSKVTGYQIQYSTSSSFSSYKTVTVSGASTVSKTISSLTKGKTYYVRVRGYKTVNGTKYYSAWSSKKSVKVSK